MEKSGYDTLKGGSGIQDHSRLFFIPTLGTMRLASNKNYHLVFDTI